MQHYRFPDGSLSCRPGDHIVIKLDERTWRVFKVQDIVRLTRLLPLGSGENANLIDESLALDSKAPTYDAEVFLLLDSFERTFGGRTEAESAFHAGSLGPARPGTCLNTRMVPKSSASVISK